MADNLELNPGSGGGKAATDEVTHSGETAHVQMVRRVKVAGAEGAKTVLDAGLVQDAETAVTVDESGPTTLATIDNSAGHKRLKCQFDVASQNLDACEVWAKAHGSAVSMNITPTSWASLPSGHYILATGVHTTSTGAYVDGDLDTVDAGQSGFFDMDIEGFSEIIVKVSAEGGAASATPRWTLSS